MTLTVHDQLDQGSPEWHDARRGLVTASVVGKLLTVGPPDALTFACPDCPANPGERCVSLSRKQPTILKTVHGSRITYAAHRPPVISVADNDTSRGLTTTLIAERITGWTEDVFVNADMMRGNEMEPFARDIYAVNYDPVTEVGFMVREEPLMMLGYSPDGLVGDNGLIEIKCPRAKTHLNTILNDEVPAHYMPQLQAGLLVSGRLWIDYVSYVSGMPLYRKRVFPDAQWFAAIRAACRAYEATSVQVVSDYLERTEHMPKTERIDNLGLVF